MGIITRNQSDERIIMIQNLNIAREMIDSILGNLAFLDDKRLDNKINEVIGALSSDFVLGLKMR